MWSIRNKILGLILILLSLILLIGSIAYYQTSFTSAKVTEITDVEHKTSVTAYEMQLNVAGVGTALLKYLNQYDTLQLQHILKYKTQFHLFQSEYERLPQTQKIKDLGNKVDSAYAKFYNHTNEIIKKHQYQSHLLDSVNGLFVILNNKLNPVVNKPVERFEIDRTNKLKAKIAIQNLQVVMNNMVKHLENYLRYHQPKFEEELQADERKFEQEYAVVLETSRGKKWMPKIKEEVKNATQLIRDILALEAVKLEHYNEFETLQVALGVMISEQILILANQNLLTAKLEAVEAANNSVKTVVLIFIISLLFAIPVSILLGANIAKRLQKLKEAALRVAKGELTLRLPRFKQNDEITELANSFNDMVDQLYLAKEEQNELLKRLKHSNKSLEEYNHVISHDLKAPLNGVALVMKMLGNDYKHLFEKEPEAQKFMDLVQERIKKLKKLIDEVLASAKEKQIQQNQKSFDSGKLVEEIVDLLGKTDHINVTVKDGLPVIHYKRIHFHQIVQNLLSNAIKYMDKSKGEIEIGCEEEEDFYKFYVKDNGMGIPEKDLSDIFNPFQTSNVIDEQISTGVGLSVVQKLIFANGGNIWVESKQKEGSCFYFTIAKHKENS